MTDHDRSEFIKVHVPCPCGRSSDAFCIREDSSGMCFSCNKSFSRKELIEQDMVDVSYEYGFMGHRSISKKTFETYGVLTKSLNGQGIEVAFPFYGPDDIECVKIRELDRKNFQVKGLGFKDCRMFGQDIFDPGSKKSITIFEGEFDAMAGYEMLRGNSACVSLKSGSGSAQSDLRKQYDYINSFDRIYICFDNDKPGQDAVRSIQGLFDFRKVY